jgi:hypothetical protein
MQRKTLINLLKIAVSIGLLIFIFSRIDFPKFLEIVSRANPGWLIAAVMLMFLGIVIRAKRWQILLDAIDISVPLKELIAIYFVGFMFNNLLPSGIGGDAMRAVEMHHHTKRTTDTVTSILLERFLGLSTLQAIGAFALLFNWNAVPPTVAYFTITIFLAMALGGYLFINRTLYITLQNRLWLFRRLTEINIIGKLFESFQRYPGPALRRSYFVSLLFNLSLIGMNMCVGLAVGVEASFIQYAIFIPITSIVLIIPISFGGLGVREGTYIELFQSIGVPEETALAMSLLVYTIGNLCSGLVGGIVYLLRIR